MKLGFDRKINVALPLAASGIRGVRFLKETNCINSILFNDSF